MAYDIYYHTADGKQVGRERVGYIDEAAHATLNSVLAAHPGRFPILRRIEDPYGTATVGGEDLVRMLTELGEVFRVAPHVREALTDLARVVQDAHERRLGLFCAGD
jgi:hypothetical protein